MPDSPLLQRPRHRFMAFSAVGAAMVCLPLWQVLRYQQSDLHQLAAERALLDPVAQAVHVQFGLLAHRQVATQLLQGKPQLEPTRQAVQQGVDEQLLALAQQLTQGLWSHALAESRDLKRDWQMLAQKVKTRSLTALQSDDAHALRMEQAVQVVDLVTQADAFSESGASHRSLGSLQFARLVRQISQLAADGPLLARADAAAAAAAASPAPEQLAAAQARLLRRLQGLQTALAAAPVGAGVETVADSERASVSAVDQDSARSAVGSSIPSAGPLAAALAEVSHQAQQLLLHAHAAQAPSTDEQRSALWAAQQRAHRAQLDLFNQALGLHKRSLGQSQTALQRQQMALWAALSLLAAAALALAAGLLRQPLRSPPPPANPGPAQGALEAAAAAWNAPPMGTAASPTKAETQRLFGRLRTHRSPATPERQPGRDTNRLEPENTLPPEHR